MFSRIFCLSSALALCFAALVSNAQLPPAVEPNTAKEAPKLTCGGFPPSEESKKRLNFEPYILMLNQRILHNWKPPKIYGNKVVAQFRIDCTGNLSNLTLQTASGIQKVDQAALKAVTRSAPFPPLPVDFSGKTVPFQFIFETKLPSY